MVPGSLNIWFSAKFVTSCVGMSSMEVTPWKMERRRLLFGSLKVWQSGEATFIPGSMRLKILDTGSVVSFKIEFCLKVISWL